MENKDSEFYLATKEGKQFVIYCSQPFVISELEILSLIRLLKVEKRNSMVGNKILDVYMDATQNRIDLTKERLTKIGVKNGEPTRTDAKTR